MIQFKTDFKFLGTISLLNAIHVNPMLNAKTEKQK